MEKVKSSKIIDLAKSEVIGFTPTYKRLEQKVILGGLSNSTLLNYGRCIAKISLHFGGRETVLKYLARYTHKIAITHHRILSYDRSIVTFKYKDYRHGNRSKTIKLAATEFIRRFVQHILPKGFRKIGHYGILSGAWKIKLFPKEWFNNKITFFCLLFFHSTSLKSLVDALHRLRFLSYRKKKYPSIKAYFINVSFLMPPKTANP